MRILDKYIIRNIALPIVFCAYTLILLFLIADVFDHLNDILQNKTPLLVVLQYYALLIPFAFSQVISWATFLGMLHIFTSFTKHNELIAMKAAGLNIFAIVRPILFLGLALSIFTFIVNDRVVPSTYKRAEELKIKFIETESEKNVKQLLENITLLDKNRQYFIQMMDTRTNILRDVRLHTVNDKHEVIERILANSATWDQDKWVFHDISHFSIGGDNKIIGEPLFIKRHIYPDITITPEDIIHEAKTSLMKSLSELREIIKHRKQSGFEFASDQVDFHAQIASPWINLIIILILIPLLACTYMRRGMVMSIIWCLLIVCSYHISNAIFIAVGKKGLLFPFVSAWGAHVLFAAGSLFFMRKGNQ